MSLLAVVLFLGTLPLVMVRAEVEAGKITFGLRADETLTVYAFADVNVGMTAVGYATINIGFPAELQMNYGSAALSASNSPKGWGVTISTGVGDTANVSIVIDKPAVSGMAADIENFLSACYFTLKTPDVYPPVGSVVTVMISEQTIVKFTAANGVTHVYEFVEFAAQANRRVLTWMEAYNAARARTFAGRRGYLATLTSIEEQMFVYNTIAQKPGWLGGTTLRHSVDGKPMIDGTSDISVNIRDFTYDRNIANVWYWADGPEAGMVFYNRAVRDDTNGPLPGVFNFFSNGWTYNKYPQYQSYIYNGREPNGDAGEYCLQFAWANKASWNDLSYNSGTVEGYYVEYDFPEGLSEITGMASAEVIVSFNVSFDVNNRDFSGAPPIYPQRVPAGGHTAVRPPVLLEGEIYREYGNRKFLGWFSDGGKFDFSLPITKDTALTAHWEQYYVVTFANTKDHYAPPQLVAGGGVAIEPETSAWEDDPKFNFYGWSADSTENYNYFTAHDFSTPVSGDMVLYGVWDPIIYSLIFDPNGGSWDGVFAPVIREYCPGAVPPWEEFNPSHIPGGPSRPGFRFNGWLDESDNAPPSAAAATANGLYFAQWEAQVYNIRYDLEGGVPGEENPGTYSVKDMFPINIGDPEREGYIFLGWAAEFENPLLEAISDPVTQFAILQGVTGDIYLTAHWRSVLGDVPPVPPGPELPEPPVEPPVPPEAPEPPVSPEPPGVPDSPSEPPVTPEPELPQDEPPPVEVPAGEPLQIEPAPGESSEVSPAPTELPPAEPPQQEPAEGPAWDEYDGASDMGGYVPGDQMEDSPQTGERRLVIGLVMLAGVMFFGVGALLRRRRMVR